MKVGLWHFGRKGGGARYTLELARELSQKDGIAASLLISSSVEGKWDYDSLSCKKYYFHTANGSFISTKKQFSNYFLPLFVILLLPIHLARFWFYVRKLDLVICTMAHPLNCLFSWMFPLLKVKYILIVHEPNGDRSVYKNLTVLLTRIEVSVTSGLVFLTESSKEVFLNSFPSIKRPFTIIPHGVFRYGTEKKADFNIKVPRLLFFGRMDSYKGIDLLLETYDILKSRILNIKLSVIGSGEMPASLKVNTSQKDITIINRWVPENEIADIFTMHDICVLPYLNATQSGIIPVASWLGLPVVCTPVGGLNEQVINGINGYVSKDMSSESLAHAIIQLIDSHNYTVISERSKTYSRENWAWNVILDSLLAFSNKL
jgi:glycosyltransferase involved in cell wall biosynthesis